MKTANKKIILSASVLVSAAAVYFVAGNSFADSPGSACVNHTLSGYAWSETVGSISFSCENNPSAPSDYGVNIDPATGKLSGHAWNAANGSDPGIGYISFDRSETGAPPSDDVCSATLDCIAKLDGERLKGWGRAISACDWVGGKCTGSGAGSNAGNWDGWIRLDCSENCGANPYDLKISSTQTAGLYPLEGYGWSGGAAGDQTSTAVIGTVKFNGPGYGVLSEVGPIPGDNKPTADFSCDNSGCQLASPAGPCTCNSNATLILNNDSTETVDDPIEDSRWYVDGVAYSDCTVYDKGNCQLVGENVPLGIHNVTLTIKDKLPTGIGDTASVTHQVTFLQGPKAGFSCSNDGVIWESDCMDLDPKPDQDSVLWLRDESINPAGGTITNRTWSYTGNPAAIFNINGNVASTTLNVIPAQIVLQVCGEVAGVSVGCDDEKQDISAIPLPVWKEKEPF